MNVLVFNPLRSVSMILFPRASIVACDKDCVREKVDVWMFQYHRKKSGATALTASFALRVENVALYGQWRSTDYTLPDGKRFIIKHPTEDILPETDNEIGWFVKPKDMQPFAFRNYLCQRKWSTDRLILNMFLKGISLEGLRQPI